MKIRNGFVSNSSSTAFVLDSSNQQVKELLPKIRQLNKAKGLGRYTSYAEGEEVTKYLNDWVSDYGFDNALEDGFPYWLQRHINSIGEENIIFVRESDEEMGGSFDDVSLSYLDIQQLAMDEFDYH